MIRLINAEVFVLFKSRVFKVLCVIAIISAIVLVGMSKLVTSEDFIKSSLNGMTPAQQEQMMQQLQSINDEDSPLVKSNNMGFRLSSKDIFHPTANETFYGSFGSGIIEIFMSVLIGAMVASEYSSGTIKNILAYGKKREYYYISKLIAITVGLIIILAIMVAVATIGATIMFGWGVEFDLVQLLKLFKVFGIAIIVGMAINSLLMLVATLVKSNGATIGIGIVVFTILPTIVAFLYGKYSWFDRLYENTTSYNWAVVTSIRATNGDLLKTVVVSLITLLIATSLGIIIFKKQDIK